jgi:taurine dioxygenase
MPYANIDVVPRNPTIGADIHGVDLSRELDDQTVADIRQAMLDHLVVFLPDQRIGPAEQLAFARRFGEVEPPHPVFDVVPEVPEVTVIEQDGTRQALYNDIWHTDVTFREKPAMATMLHCQITPVTGGGDTLWSSLQAPYEALSSNVRAMIEDMTATHDYYIAFADSVLNGRGGIEKLAKDIIALPPREHPVVRTHPETGRKGLFVNRTFTKHLNGVGYVESEHILRMLCEFAEHPNYQVRHTWKPYDLALWDNRATMHLATSNFTSHRKMHRITLLGDKPYH